MTPELIIMIMGNGITVAGSYLVLTTLQVL